MKRILIHSTLALTLAATAAFAQQSAPAPAETQNSATAQQPAGARHHHPFDAHKAAQHMGKKLGLTDDQTAKLEPILNDHQQKISALRADTSLTQDQRRQQIRSIMKDTHAQFATVLTPRPAPAAEVDAPSGSARTPRRSAAGVAGRRYPTFGQLNRPSPNRSRPPAPAEVRLRRFFAPISSPISSLLFRKLGKWISLSYVAETLFSAPSKSPEPRTPHSPAWPPPS